MFPVFLKSRCGEQAHGGATERERQRVLRKLHPQPIRCNSVSSPRSLAHNKGDRHDVEFPHTQQTHSRLHPHTHTHISTHHIHIQAWLKVTESLEGGSSPQPNKVSHPCRTQGRSHQFNSYRQLLSPLHCPPPSFASFSFAFFFFAPPLASSTKMRGEEQEASTAECE